MIEVHELTKRYGDVLAVDAMTFTVEPGVVTGFLGPNGAGKSTTMRAILGLDALDGGRVTVNGRRYRDSAAPIAEVGALLDGKSVDKARSARNHLRAVGATVGVGRRRVEEVLDLVGLAEVAGKPAGGFSLGMGQRLGIATALLADPQVVMLDEPVNGLDPDGIAWIRGLLSGLAAQGRTVFVSSHLMSEMEMTAEHLIVVGRGRVLADESMASFIARMSGAFVRVASPDAAALADVLGRAGAELAAEGPGVLQVRGMAASEIGERAAAGGLVLHELHTHRASLEEAFMAMTEESLQYHGSTEIRETA
jgi:ABC-2 type transport system ATP-binding protein